MKRRTNLSMMLGLALLCALPGTAQEQGSWRAASKTAESITGDVIFTADKLTIDYVGFIVSQIRPLQPAEISAAFDGSDAAAGAGHLYRLNIAADRRFLHKNTLCGSDATQWMATFVSGKELRTAFFSGATPPVLTFEAFNNSTNLCGAFTYAR